MPFFACQVLTFSVFCGIIGFVHSDDSFRIGVWLLNSTTESSLWILFFTIAASFSTLQKNHSAKAVDEALDELFATFGDKYLEVFKTITSDNGSEFANLSRLEEKGIGIYFTHPYTSCEKGTVECHNRMLRRFIPKGKSIDDYSADEIMIFADIMNALPRKLLGYHTPEELFDAELDRIYAV